MNSNLARFIIDIRGFIRPALLGVSVFVLGCLLLDLLPFRLVLIFSKSVKYDWLAVWTEDVRYLRQGDYVLFPWRGVDPQGKGLRDGMILLKRLGCLPGQHLQSDAATYSCDGVSGRAPMAFDSQGRRLQPFVFDDLVPIGKLFVVGDAWNSYDSRYWGFVDRGRVIGKVIWGF